MKTSLDAPVTLVDDTAKFDPRVLLEAIETDPEAFTTGRRNDDVVNWFFAKRLVENDTPGGLDRFPVRKYVESFKQLELTVEQDDALYIKWPRESNMNPEQKLIRLWSHYGHITDKDEIRNLWLPTMLRVSVCNTEPMF